MIMAGPGEYVSDITEGITSVEDLPKAKIKRCSRKRKKQPTTHHRAIIHGQRYGGRKEPDGITAEVTT